MVKFLISLDRNDFSVSILSSLPCPVVVVVVPTTQHYSVMCSAQSYYQPTLPTTCDETQATGQDLSKLHEDDDTFQDVNYDKNGYLCPNT